MLLLPHTSMCVFNFKPVRVLCCKNVHVLCHAVVLGGRSSPRHRVHSRTESIRVWKEVNSKICREKVKRFRLVALNIVDHQPCTGRNAIIRSSAAAVQSRARSSAGEVRA